MVLKKDNALISSISMEARWTYFLFPTTKSIKITTKTKLIMARDSSSYIRTGA